MATKFSRALTKALRDSGMSRKEVADQVRVGLQTIRNWEIGANRPGRPQEQILLRLVLGNFDDELGFWLREFRESLGQSVAQFSNDLGLTQPTIYNIESGSVRQPQTATREALVGAIARFDDTNSYEEEEDEPAPFPVEEPDEPPAESNLEPILPSQGLAVRYTTSSDGLIDIDRGARLSELELAKLTNLRGSVRSSC